MKAWGRLTIVGVAASLAACAAAPGMKMKEPAEVSDGVVVRVQPITIELLNRMEAAREQQVQRCLEVGRVLHEERPAFGEEHLEPLVDRDLRLVGPRRGQPS